jgi:YgiT-type zinc finger domain-containing protein
MECPICKHGETVYGNTTVTLNRENTIIIIKDVPADICGNCGEYFLNETISEWVLNKAEMAAEQGTEIEVLRYAA